MKELIELRARAEKLTLCSNEETCRVLQDLLDALERMTAAERCRTAQRDEAEFMVKQLTAENAALKEVTVLQVENYAELKEQNDALHGYFNSVLQERDALRADAELKYTAWQSPHNDDLWLENPADCEIIDNFHPPVHVGFEYELTAGSYTTQRYRVVKIADAESDDVLVELIEGEKHA